MSARRGLGRSVSRVPLPRGGQAAEYAFCGLMTKALCYLALPVDICRVIVEEEVAESWRSSLSSLPLH